MSATAGTPIDWTERRLLFGREVLVWQANLYALLTVTFVAFIGFNFASPFIPILVREAGITDPAAAAIWSGIILGAGPIGAVLTGPFWGKVADKIGGRATLSRTVFGFGVLTAVMAFSTDAWHLAVLRLGMGLLGGFTTVAAAMASMSSPPERTTRSIALVQSAQIVSLVVGPALGGIMADHLGIRATFLGSAALAGFAFVTMLVLYRDPVAVQQARTRAAQGGPRPGFWEILKTPCFLPLLLVLIVGNFTDRAFQPLVPLFVPGLDVPATSVASTSGFIVAAGAVAATFSANAAGRLVQRFTHTQLLFVSQILAAIGCALIALTQTAWQFGILRTEVGLFGGSVLTLAYGLGSSLIPIERRGTAFGVLATGAMLGGALSPVAGGLVGAYSLRAAFLLNAVIFLIGAGIVWFGLGFGRIQTAESARRAGT